MPIYAPPNLAIIVTTRDRPDTLPHCLRTVRDFTSTDVTVVISDNGETDSRAIFDAYALENWHYIRSSQRLLVVPHHEFAMRWTLDSLRPDYFTFLGDDDGLMPGGVAFAANVLAAHRPEGFGWAKASYSWPGLWFEGSRSQIDMQAVRALEWRSSSSVRAAFESWALDWRGALSIYNGFVSAELAHRVEASGQRVMPGVSQDVSSSLQLPLFSKRGLWSRRPVTISGQSKHSIGMRAIHNFGDRTAAMAEVLGGSECGLSGLPYLAPCDALVFLDEMLTINIRHNREVYRPRYESFFRSIVEKTRANAALRAEQFARIGEWAQARGLADQWSRALMNAGMHAEDATADIRNEQRLQPGPDYFEVPNVHAAACIFNELMTPYPSWRRPRGRTRAKIVSILQRVLDRI